MVNLINRVFFAIKNLFSYKDQLKKYLIDNSLQINSIVNITNEIMKNKKIKAFILDFDGVLASHNKMKIKPEVEDWLHNIINTFNKPYIFILSNNPYKDREIYFLDKFEGLIKFVYSKNKKPYPDGVNEIINNLKGKNIQAIEILLVDDRIATGILAGELTGVTSMLITEPYVDFSAKPIKESFYWLLRRLERAFIWVV